MAVTQSERTRKDFFNQTKVGRLLVSLKWRKLMDNQDSPYLQPQTHKVANQAKLSLQSLSNNFLKIVPRAGTPTKRGITL